ncbi:MAG TPA: hypothetical protein DCY88_34170, partial [Cyanobacteria bacterium UBA11372]|nr:hypothetical protein [Cyanobacteria bacterium UBA11372]
GRVLPAMLVNHEKFFKPAPADATDATGHDIIPRSDPSPTPPRSGEGLSSPPSLAGKSFPAPPSLAGKGVGGLGFPTLLTASQIR